MFHNKGTKYINCEECNKKRYCKKEYLGHRQIKWICSKKHYWITKIPRIEEIVAVEAEKIIPKLSSLFERDDIFFSKLKNK